MTRTHSAGVQEHTDIAGGGGYINPARHVRAFGVRRIFHMTGSSRSSEGLEPRRKKLLFRCWHRGTREMDLLLGRFADAHIAEFSEAELTELEQLIELPDPDLYAAFSEKAPLPPGVADGIFQRIKAFGAAGSAV